MTFFVTKYMLLLHIILKCKIGLDKNIQFNTIPPLKVSEQKAHIETERSAACCMR